MHKEEIKKKWAQEWNRCGMLPGDTILVHSSSSRTLREAKAQGVTDIAPADLLESFLMALGPQGTLLLPLFNFAFISGTPFDMRSTPSEMGALSECGRLYPGALRTKHPIYSFAAIGPQAKLFEKAESPSGYGPDSPFGILRTVNGKIGVLDLPDQNSMTFYHHIEELSAVTYRYHKHFTGQYTDMTGHTSEKTVSLFVRDLEKRVLTDVDRMGEHLWELGLYHGDRPGVGAGLRTISSVDMFDATTQIIREGRAIDMLYSIGKFTG